MYLMQDLLQKFIILYGLEETIYKLFYDSHFYEMFKDREDKIYELTLTKLDFELYHDRNNFHNNYKNILFELLLITKHDFNLILDHDELLKLCLKKNKQELIDFILKSRNYFDSILMLLNAVNKEIKKAIVDIALVAKYLLILREYNINYLPEIETQVSSYIRSQLYLYNSIN